MSVLQLIGFAVHPASGSDIWVDMSGSNATTYPLNGPLPFRRDSKYHVYDNSDGQVHDYDTLVGPAWPGGDPPDADFHASCVTPHVRAGWLVGTGQRPRAETEKTEASASGTQFAVRVDTVNNVDYVYNLEPATSSAVVNVKHLNSSEQPVAVATGEYAVVSATQITKYTQGDDDFLTYVRGRAQLTGTPLQ